MLLGDDEGLPAHHIIPLADHGYDEAFNLIVLCPNCHLVAHRIWETRKDWLIREGKGYEYREQLKHYPFDRDMLLRRLREVRECGHLPGAVA